MATSREAITGDLCEWFFGLTGVPFIQANPQTITYEGQETASVKPQGLFGSVALSTFTRIGNADDSLQSNDIESIDIVETIVGWRETVVSIITYRSGAFDLLADVEIKLMRQSTRDYFKSVGLGFQSNSAIRNISSATSAGLEERYQLDLKLITCVSDQDIITSIQSLNVQGYVDSISTENLRLDLQIAEQ